MASKKKGQLSKHCRIFQWIEAKDPDFAGAIRDLCLEGTLSPSGRSPGVTFLYPKDKAYRDKVVDKAYSADADEAAKIIESLIIPDALLQGADFQRRPVGSRLGVKYGVETAERGKVKLANGVELVASDDFHPLARREGALAVWLISKGELPLTGEAYKAPAPERKARDGVRGGAGAGDGAPALNSRQTLAASTEGEFDLCMKRDKCRAHNPYLAKVVSLLACLRAKRPELLPAVMPVLDYDPLVTFYLLIEPYKTLGGHLIPEDVLFGEGAWNGTDCYGDAVEEYKDIFRSMPGQSAASAADPQTGSGAVPYVFRDRAAVAAQADVARHQLGGNNNPRQLPQQVQDVYAILSAQNTIGGMGPVLPDVAKTALAAGKKLWQDELRFTLHQALQEMRHAPYSTATFASIVRDLREAWPGNNYTAEARLSNVADQRANVSPRTELLLLTKFVNSTDFLYLPVTPDDAGAAWGSMDPTDETVYNRNAVALSNLQKIDGMARPAGISPQALLELELYAQAHGGQLPPAVVALAGRR